LKRKEKRQSVRVNTPESVANCRVLSAETGGQFQFAVWPVKNIGNEGVAILSEHAISTGAQAFLNIDLDVILKTIGVIAKVIWCNKVNARYEIGLNFFLWPNTDDKKLVSAFITSKIEYADGRKYQPEKTMEST
jgi:hypothetical protein